MNETDILDSWTANAGAWTDAVRSGSIASRRTVTDAAIFAAVTRLRPRRVLDAGCGEGWLTRRLAASGDCEAVGFDGVAELVGRAASGGGDASFVHLSYEDFIARPERIDGGFDVAVLNYAVFTERADELFAALKTRLAAGGHLVLQTLHPWSAGGGAYRDGWRTEDFAAFAGGGWRAMPWYFRTLESWIAELCRGGFAVTGIVEPRAADGDAPLSLILIARADA